MRIKTKLIQVTLITGLLIAQFIPCVHAWDNNYSQDNTYDSYSQSWDNYKQQNNINTQQAAQRSWIDNAYNWVSNVAKNISDTICNFASNVVAPAYDAVKNFVSNICTTVSNYFNPPETKTATIKTEEQHEEKFVPYDERLSGADKNGWHNYEAGQLQKDPDAQRQKTDSSYTPNNQLSFSDKEHLWFNQFISLSDTDKANCDAPTASQKQLTDWQSNLLPQNSDKVGFFDALPPDTANPNIAVMDKIDQAFAAYNNLSLSPQKYVDGALDATKRVSLAAASTVVGEGAGQVAKTIGLNKIGQFAVNEIASDTTNKIINPDKISMNAADLAIVQDIGKQLNQINPENITGISYQENIIGAQEANQMNKQLSIGPYAVGAVAGAVAGIATKSFMTGLETTSTVASAVGVISPIQPYAAGQVEYKAVIQYNDPNHPLYNCWQVNLNYRVGTYSTPTQPNNTGVIAAGYTKSYIDPMNYTTGYTIYQKESDHAND